MGVFKKIGGGFKKVGGVFKNAGGAVKRKVSKRAMKGVLVAGIVALDEAFGFGLGSELIDFLADMASTAITQ